MIRAIDCLLVAFALVVPACQQLTRIGNGADECVPTEVQAAFDRSCAGAACHTNGGHAGGLGLGNGEAASAIGRPATGSPLSLVEIGDTRASYLAQKLVASPSVAITGARMPIGFDVANAEQVADVDTILAWIAGAELAGCAGGTGDTGSADTGTPGEGLPCEVDAVLDDYCRGCHGDPPVGASFSLLTRDDLLAAAPSAAGKTVGEQSIARMSDDTAPMPPAPAQRPSAEELAVIADWVAAGMPAGDCMPEPGPFDVDPVCTSKKTWTGGNEESPLMHPGRACNQCHTQEHEGPIFRAAGTVYPTGHEPNDCNGAPSIIVQLTDSNQQVVEAKANSAGNFMITTAGAAADFAPPYQVKVRSELGERVMVMPAPHGDCNVCHTQDGDQDALGRVVLPW